MNEEQFKEWLNREMPEGTVIGNPEWWAKKIWQVALATQAPTDDERVRELEKDAAEKDLGAMV